MNAKKPHRRRLISYILILVAIAIILTITTAGLTTVIRSVSSSGRITGVNVGVYSNSACTTTLTSIDWGSLNPGQSVTKTIYVKNTGSLPISLDLSTNGWSPEISNQVIKITWDKGGASLAASRSTAAKLTLTVSNNTQGITSFSVNIVITGSG